MIRAGTPPLNREEAASLAAGVAGVPSAGLESGNAGGVTLSGLFQLVANVFSL